MRNLTQNELDQRLSSVGEDKEFKELIYTYNIMMERLEASFHQATRFSGDAAHEIRTPLTILQGKLEQAFNRSDDPVLQADFTYMLDEVARLSAITRKLLMLSHADAGKLALHQTDIDLTTLLKELMEDLRMLSADHQLAADIAENQIIRGDAVLLQQVLNNLISNAIRYGSPQGRISIQSSNDKEGVVVIISNTSAPITQGERARFFERFYRGDPAHNRHIDGNGLGLSLALEIAKAHGGDLRLETSEIDIVKIRLWLPAK
jgi:two-component system heavy metal sensor histidine kinase CusS